MYNLSPGIVSGANHLPPQKMWFGKDLEFIHQDIYSSKFGAQKGTRTKCFEKNLHKKTQQQTTNQRKQLPTSQHTPLPCLPSEAVLHQVKPIISTGLRSLRTLSAQTPVMLWLGSWDPAVPFSWLECQSLWAPAQTVSSAAAQAWLDVGLDLPGQPGNLSSFTGPVKHLLHGPITF